MVEMKPEILCNFSFFIIVLFNRELRLAIGLIRITPTLLVYRGVEIPTLEVGRQQDDIELKYTEEIRSF